MMTFEGFFPMQRHESSFGAKRTGASPHSSLTPEEIAWLDGEIEHALSNIPIPEPDPATSEELERRREVFERITRLREEIGTLSIAASELIRMDRGWPAPDGSTHG